MSPPSDLQLAFDEALTDLFRNHRQGDSARALEWKLDTVMGRLHADTLDLCTTRFSECGHHLVSLVTGIVGHGFQGGNSTRSFLDRLIMKGVDINIPDSAGRRPLVQAMFRHSELMQLHQLEFVLDKPLDWLAVDCDRNSLLSVRYGDPDVRQAIQDAVRHQWQAGTAEQQRTWLESLLLKPEESHEPLLAELRQGVLDQSLSDTRAAFKSMRL